MFFGKTETEKINEMIKKNAKTAMTDSQIIKLEVEDWIASPKRALMLIGEQYYLNKTDIQNKKRQLANGTELKNRNNARLEHAFIRKLVDQKIGYLLSKKVTIETENETYSQILTDMFQHSFWRLIKNVGREAINKGIAWLQVYFKEDGNIAFKHIPSEEIIPLWGDNAHEELEGLIRVYDVLVYRGYEKQVERKVEYWTAEGVQYLIFHDGDLVEDVEIGDEEGQAINYHFKLDGVPQNWTRIPFIPFRYNDLEQPIIDTLKSLIDNYNTQASVNADILADIPKFIYKLIGYGGQNLDEFMNDLQQFLAIKLHQGGDVDKLQAEPNTEAVESLLAQARKDLFEFGRGVSLDDIKSGGNTTNLKIKALFSDLDMDANILETEFHMSFENLMWFIDQYLLFTGQGDYVEEDVNFILNRDILASESEIITDVKNSVGILSRRTLVMNHPYTDDVEEELKQIEEEEEKERDEYEGTFNQNTDPVTSNGD